MPSDLEQPVRQADAEEVEFSLFDFGIDKVVSDIEMENDCAGQNCDEEQETFSVISLEAIMICVLFILIMTILIGIYFIFFAKKKQSNP